MSVVAPTEGAVIGTANTLSLAGSGTIYITSSGGTTTDPSYAGRPYQLPLHALFEDISGGLGPGALTLGLSRCNDPSPDCQHSQEFLHYFVNSPRPREIHPQGQVDGAAFAGPHQPAHVAFSYPAPWSGQLLVRDSDRNNAIIRTYAYDARKAGRHDFYWDGRDLRGHVASQHHGYFLDIRAKVGDRIGRVTGESGAVYDKTPPVVSMEVLPLTTPPRTTAVEVRNDEYGYAKLRFYRGARQVALVSLPDVFQSQHTVYFDGAVPGGHLPAGTYRVRAEVTDRAGNTGRSGWGSVVVG